MHIWSRNTLKFRGSEPANSTEWRQRYAQTQTKRPHNLRNTNKEASQPEEEARDLGHVAENMTVWRAADLVLGLGFRVWGLGFGV